MSQEQSQQFRPHRIPHSLFLYPKHRLMTVALAGLISLLSSCGGGSLSPVKTVSALPGTVKVTTDPGLMPAFDPRIKDYVVAYNPGSPVQLTVNVPTTTKVTLAGQTVTASSTTQVNVTPGQSFSFVVKSPANSRTYHVRCLPTDFPTWTTERPARPQAEYYIIAPSLSFNPAVTGHYVIVADNTGTPIWWYKSANQPVDAKLLPNGNFAWTGAPTGEERRFDGSLVRTFKAAASPDGTLDVHELLLLPNGDYLFIADVKRGPVDLSPYGGSAAATVIDNVIEEVTPNGALVWQWSAMAHIPVSETAQDFWASELVAASPADPYHMNSVEVNGSSLVISFRHLNALIGIDKASGNRLWKLGGTTCPESLTFVGDPYSNFGGQHDARILPDGTLTVHDDGTFQKRGPRGVRYSLNLTARTAAFVEQVTDSDVPASNCCGSARKLVGGNWVMSWGDTPDVTELTEAGARVFRMTINSPFFSYRAVPVLPGVLTRAALRAGMDAQYPR